MKVLAEGKPGCTYLGFQRAIEAAGHTWVWWQEDHRPAFDAFDEIKPDVLFCMEGQSRALTKCIGEFSPLVIRGYNESPFQFDMGPEHTIDFQRLYDSHIFHSGATVSDVYSCNICLVSDVCPIGLRLVHDFGLNIKVISESNQKWPVIQYMGMASLQQKQLLYSSAHVVVVTNAVELMRVIACQKAIPIAIGDHPTLDFFDEFRRDDHKDIIDTAMHVQMEDGWLEQEVVKHRDMLNNKSYNFAWQFILETANEKGQLSN